LLELREINPFDHAVHKKKLRYLVNFYITFVFLFSYTKMLFTGHKV